MLSAAELHRRGLECSNSGRYAAARTLLTRGLERAEVPQTRARVLLSLAYVDAELGSTQDGLARCAEALAEPDLPEHVRGLVESQRAGLYMRSGAGSEALAAFARAIALLGDSEAEPLARAHLNRGLVHLQRGDAAEAEHDARRAGELYRLAGNDIAAAKADHNLGCARLLSGDLVSALRLIESAAPLVETLSPTYRAVVATDRAEVLVAAGMPAEARLAFESAARAYGSRRLRQRQAEVELMLARSMVWEEPRRAAVIARRAARRFRSRGSVAWALRAEAIQVSAELDAGPPAGLAAYRRHAVEVAASLREHGFPNDAATATIAGARAALRAGDRPAASRALRSVRTTSGTPLGVRLLAQEARAELAATAGRRHAALDHVRRGLDDLHGWQSTFGSLDLQSSVVGHGRRLAFAGLRLAVADGRPATVFEWSERARSLGSRVTEVRPPADPDAVRALAELRQLGDEAAAADLRTTIRQQAWYGAGSHHVGEVSDLDRAVAELGSADAALTSYLVVDDTVHCLVVWRGTATVVELGGFAPVSRLLAGLQADLDMVASDLPASMLDVVAAALLARVGELGERIVTPVLPAIDGAERVVIVPTALLAGTPWSLLPGLQGRVLTVPRSATRWMRARSRGPLTVGRVGLVAGPRVHRAAEEVHRAAARWPDAEELTGAAATAAAVSALAERVDVLHVAAHGRHSAENPLFSGLELADGPWFGYDIDQLASIPATVVLSACELGRSASRWGLETIGMTVAWQHAGARCVIAAPASVADDVACEVLADTHAGLAAGRNPAEALRDAVMAEGVGDPRRRLASFFCHGAAF